MAQECMSLVNLLLAQLARRKSCPSGGVRGARVKWDGLPMWVENPSNPLPADLGPLPLPEPGPATPPHSHPHPTPGPQNSIHIRKAFSLYFFLPGVWLINDARGITPISLGCVIPQSDWGIERGEVTLPRAGDCHPVLLPAALLRTYLDR